MKTKNKLIIFTLAIAFLCMATLAGCNPKTGLILTIDGDAGIHNVEPDSLKRVSFEYIDKSGETVKEKGWKVSDALASLETEIKGELLITAKDGTGALVDTEGASEMFIYADEDKLNIKAPKHPPVASIKDISEITYIAEKETAGNFSLVYTDRTEKPGSGRLKLKLFDKTGDSNKDGIYAKKYVRNDITVQEFTDNDKNVVYFEDFDYATDMSEKVIGWKNGKATVDGRAALGIVTGTADVISGAYDEMRASIDAGQRVMLILTDGFSYQQAEYYKNELSLLADGYKRAASVNPAISNVGLASIVTGGSPKANDIYVRKVAAPALPDIFQYAADKGKRAAYIEGNGNLIITSLSPVLTSPDVNNETDYGVYENAKIALANDPDLLFVHFHGIDDVNHGNGPISEPAREKILEVEGYVEELTKDFIGKIIIVSDHGHVSTGDGQGGHGKFYGQDMYVPYYILEKNA